MLLLGLALGVIGGYLYARSQAVKQQEILRLQQEAQLQEQRAQQERQLQELKAQQQEQLESLRTQQREQLEQQLRLIKAEMNTASEKILKERARELSATNEEQLSNILNPLRKTSVR